MCCTVYCNVLMLCSKSVAGFYIFSAIPNTYALVLIRICLTSISLLTFDPLIFVSPPLCFSESISEIYIPAFDTLAALYPFTLLLLTYIGIELHARDFKPIVSLWRPLKGNYERFIRSWDPNKSLIQVLATLFFLSFTKFLIITYEAFEITRVFNMQSEVVTRVSYIDPTVIPYSHKHMPLIFLSVIILSSLFHLQRFFWQYIPPGVSGRSAHASSRGGSLHYTHSQTRFRVAIRMVLMEQETTEQYLATFWQCPLPYHY